MLSDIDDVYGRRDAGGKAAGLSFLKRHGFNIPETCVLRAAGTVDPDLLDRYISPGKLYAVRSSASDEDSTGNSFAGQYETFLNVGGIKDIINAIEACRKSLHSRRSDIYRKKHGIIDETFMSVIIQEMVDAAYAGVVFSVDAPGQRFDRMIVSVVKGLGEKLVSGHSGGETLHIFRNSKQIPVSRYLKPEMLSQIIYEAKKIESDYHAPVDLEWAIDKNGLLFWLQVRPITGLPTEHLNELDHQPAFTEPLYTRGNIGEMMPGPVTPLTLSIFGRAIDLGLQYFYKNIGAIPEVIPDRFIFLHSFYNHLFFDMNALYQFASRVALSEKENIELSVAGELIPEKALKRERKGIRAWINFIKLTILLSRAPCFQKKLVRLSARTNFSDSRDCLTLWKEIDLKKWDLFRAYYYHYITSAQSGSYYTTVTSILAGGKIPGRKEQEIIAPLLSNIENVESAEALKELNNLALCISDLSPGFANMPVEDALNFLFTEGPAVIRDLFEKFLLNHGHRGIKEAEFRTNAWLDDPGSLVPVIQEKTKHGKLLVPQKDNLSYNYYLSILRKKISRGQYLAIKFFTPRLRSAVARREFTKSACIKFQRKYKMAYLLMAGNMVKKGILDDPDQVFFLTHEEIGRAVADKNPDWKRKANARRVLQEEFDILQFPDIIHGIPVPFNEEIYHGKDELTGIPVSKGIIRGRVRIVEKLEDAESLQKGEIMVARFTDVGWTPYFGIAGGIITEIGSPISHGAVVAREYGIPAIVSVKGATKILYTGQSIELNGHKGTIDTEHHVEAGLQAEKRNL